MNTMKATERGLIAAFIILDIVCVLLFTYNFLFASPSKRDMIPIFLMIMLAIYFETKKQLEAENKNFEHKKVLRVLMSCLVITESMSLILYIL